MLATTLTLSDRTFSAVGGGASPPPGPYVAYRERYYPVTKGHYPLRVLAEVAADLPGQLVLVPAANGVVAVITGMDRIVHLQRDEYDSEGFFRALLRLSLASQSSEIITLGHIDGLPAKEKSISDLVLPVVINPKKTWRLLVVVGAMLLAGFALGLYVQSLYTGEVGKAQRELAAANAEMDQLLSAVRAGRATLATANNNVTTEKATDAAATLPINTQLFSETINLNGAQPTALIVKNGRLSN